MNCPFGSHRSLEPINSLPQAAWKVDAQTPAGEREILVEVDTLNIDSASFTQLEEECEHDLERLSRRIVEIVSERGKMHNPVTGSGGMLMGTIAAVGSKLQGVANAQGHRAEVGLKIASLVSLSLTPLRLGRVLEIRPDSDQVKVEAQAILFESSLWCPLPSDLPQEVSLAALDVAGAAAQVARLVQPGDRVLVMGAGGKSGLLCCYEARRRLGPHGLLLGLERHPEGARDLEELGFCDRVLNADAQRPVEVLQAVQQATGGLELDLVINCVNIPATEMSCILPLRQRGKVYFFSMATSFTAAALGAEGVGKDVDLLMGNGFARGHDLTTLEILRQSPALRRLFTRRYAPALLAETQSF